MNDNTGATQPRKSANWGGRALNLLLALTLLVALLPMASTPVAAALRAQPQLLQLAAEQPGARVSVIVQKTAKDDRVETMVAALGGEVTKDLHIINAFAAEMSAGAATQLARADGVRWISLDAPVRQAATTNVFTTWASSTGTVVTNGFANSASMVDSFYGASGAYGYGSNVKGSFSGFVAEVTPGNSITKVEIVLQAYAPQVLEAAQDPILSACVAGKCGKTKVLNHHALDTFVGAANTGTVYVDITGTRTWQWSDFDNGLEVLIDQGKFKSTSYIYYDAVGLRVTSSSGADTTGGTGPTALPKAAIDTSKMVNAYAFAVRAPDVWNEGPNYLQGQGLTVAVVDSGIVKHYDLTKRLIARANFNSEYHDSVDRYGHGTFVASILAGDGGHSKGQYVGIAPKTNVANVRISNDQGMATESDVVKSLQWVNDNKAKYNIKVVNLSLNSSVAQSYHTSPLDAAAEILWFNGIVVVASAGNNGTANLYPPANDPFVITVGATDDRGTRAISDDVIAPFSAYGVTEAGTTKPEIVAPGANIIAYLPENAKTTIGNTHGSNQVNASYFRMSGTSMSAPMVAGAAALLLQDEPALTPDQVKYRLMATANKTWPGYSATTAGAGYLDVYAAVKGTTTESANNGLQASQLLWTGSAPAVWGSVNWNSVNWNSVNWNSVNWNSVNWNSVNWNSDYWGP